MPRATQSGNGSATVRGKITDAGGNPVAGAKVFAVPATSGLGVKGSTVSTITGRDGVWELKLVPSKQVGRYTFIINGVSRSVEVVDGVHSIEELPWS